MSIPAERLRELSEQETQRLFSEQKWADEKKRELVSGPFAFVKRLLHRGDLHDLEDIANRRATAMAAIRSFAEKAAREAR